MNFAKVMFLQVCVCPQGGHAWWQGGVCGGRGGMCGGRGGMCGGGGGMCGGGHAWWQGGMRGGRGGHAWWQGGVRGGGGACVVEGVHGREGHACDYDEIRSMSGRYAFYWKTFLLIYKNNILYISAKA